MLKVHILNVGHGDCTIIKHHSGRLTMIDINNSQDYDEETYKEIVKEESAKLHKSVANLLYAVSQTAKDQVAVEASAVAKREIVDPVDFIKKKYPGERLWRFILTHPDLDHMRGIHRVYQEVGINNFWDTKNTKPTPSFRSDGDKIDWEFYQQLRAGKQNISSKYYTRGTSLYAFGLDESGSTTGSDNIEILSPSPQLVKRCNVAKKSNDLSLVLRVSHAGKSILLTGDAESEAWDAMVETYGAKLKSTFLKAPHHGRDSAYHLEALKHISPSLVFVSVGRKPDTDASSKYRQQSDRVASTRYHGNIELQINDDGTYKWFVERNPD